MKIKTNSENNKKYNILSDFMNKFVASSKYKKAALKKGKNCRNEKGGKKTCEKKFSSFTFLLLLLISTHTDKYNN